MIRSTLIALTAAAAMTAGLASSAQAKTNFDVDVYFGGGFGPGYGYGYGPGYGWNDDCDYVWVKKWSNKKHKYVWKKKFVCY